MIFGPKYVWRWRLTESSVMHGSRQSTSWRAAAGTACACSASATFAIDDFGTGYSSLTYLQRFSYDSLKIDRSFVDTVDVEGEGSAIVRAIVALANSLGMKVVAEGVETKEQLAKLRSLDCPEAQGYWFSRPLNPTDIQRYLTDQAGKPN